MVNSGDELDEKYFEWIARVAPYIHGKHLYVPGGVTRSYLSRGKKQDAISDVESETVTSSSVGVNELGTFDSFTGEAINTQYKQEYPLGNLLEVLSGGHEYSAENK
jgi:hypothetical protein